MYTSGSSAFLPWMYQAYSRSLSRLSKIIQMRERWCEHAAQHLTISNMLLPHLSYVTVGGTAAHLVFQRIPGLGIAARFVHVLPSSITEWCTAVFIWTIGVNISAFQKYIDLPLLSVDSSPPEWSYMILTPAVGLTSSRSSNNLTTPSWPLAAAHPSGVMSSLSGRLGSTFSRSSNNLTTPSCPR